MWQDPSSLVYSQLHKKKTAFCNFKVVNIVDIATLGIVGASGQLYMEPSIEYAGTNRVLQWLYPIFGAIGTTAPNLWAAIKMLDLFHSSCCSEALFKRESKGSGKIVVSILKELALSLSGAVSIVPFVEISLENNKNGLWWTIDISIARFLLQYFGLRAMFSSVSLRYPHDAEEKMLANLKNQFLNILEDAKMFLALQTAEMRKVLLSARYDEKNGSLGLLRVREQKLLEELVNINSVIGGKQQENCIPRYTYTSVTHCSSWGKKIIGLFGAGIAAVGLSGYFGETFRAIGKITDYVPNNIAASILQYLGTGFCMLPLTYLVASKGKEVFEYGHEFFLKLVHKEVKKYAANSLLFVTTPKITLSLWFVSVAIASLSWATNAKITDEMFQSDSNIQLVFRIFAILTSIIFNGYSLAVGVVNPSLRFIVNSFGNENAKDIAGIWNGVDKLISTIKSLTSEEFYKFWLLLSNAGIHIERLNGCQNIDHQMLGKYFINKKLKLVSAKSGGCCSFWHKRKLERQAITVPIESEFFIEAERSTYGSLN
ncbi:MAG: hypothetical protein WCW01_04370 [Gammaproteobacteria bacterium]